MMTNVRMHGDDIFQGVSVCGRVGIVVSFAASDWSVASIPALSLVETDPDSICGVWSPGIIKI